MYISHQAIGFFILFVLIWALAYAINHWFKASIRSPRRPAKRGSRRPVDADPYSKLVVICLGDKAKADRLIAFEQSRNSRLSRFAAIQAAIDSVARDNHHY
jgi:hypothetical protein